MEQRKSIEDIQRDMNVLNIANEAGVLLGLLAEKLKVTPDKEFWRNIIQSYSELQAESRKAQEEFTDAVEQGLVPKSTYGASSETQEEQE